ncbi:MAG: hypothetical protein ACOY41_03210 [Pseudomonadota bacterium]
MMPRARFPGLFGLGLMAACVGLAPAARALETMEDDGLAAIHGGDGITLELSNTTIANAATRWHVDKGVTAVGSVTINPYIWGQLETLSLKPIAVDGSAASGLLRYTATFDVTGGGAGVPAAALSLNGTRTRLLVEKVVQQTDTTRSLGSFALDTQLAFSLSNSKGLFNSVDSTAALSVDTGDAKLFYRQGAAGQPEALFDALRFKFDFTGGKVGLNATGLFAEAASANLDAGFSLRYEGAPATADAFTKKAGDLPVLQWNWLGKLNNLQLYVKRGGAWYGTDGGGVEDTANRSGGINMSLRWDYDSAFAWYTQEPGSNIRAVFGNWQKLAGAPYALNFPNITLDVLKAGQEPGGLCWRGTSNGPSCPGGGQYLNVPAEDGFALLVRDGNLHAYSTSVRLQDDINKDGDYNDTSAAPLNTPENEEFPWALIYTLGDVDANVFVAPGTGAASTTGMKLDGIVKIQSNSSAWNSSSHFMIADTAAPKGAGTTTLGIGFLRTNVLFAFNDMLLRLQSGGINLNSSQVRVGFAGRFGGGEIKSGDLATADEVKLLDVDANLEFDRFDVTLSPSPSGQSYMGFATTLRFADLNIADFSGSDPDGSYITLFEPGRSDVSLRLAKITGDLAVTNGRVDLLSEAETNPRTAQLKLGGDIRFGTTAVAGGSPFLINSVKLGADNFAAMVIPSGQWQSSIALTKQR